LGERRPSLQDLDEGIDTNGQIYNAIMGNPHIQLSLTNPKVLIGKIKLYKIFLNKILNKPKLFFKSYFLFFSAFLSIIETPASANAWLNDPEVSPALSQISKTYQAEKHFIHMNRFI
jgi:Kip1 ubiquitination-promoting complex protein 2